MNYKFLGAILLFFMMMSGCKSYRVDPVDPVPGNNVVLTKLESIREQASKHSVFLCDIEGKLRALSSDKKITEEQAKEIIRQSYMDSDIPMEMKSDVFFEKVYEEPTVNSDKLNCFTPSFIDELSTAIEVSATFNDLRESLISLLNRYESMSNFDDYVLVVAITLDSYNFWDKKQPTTRGKWGNIAKIIKGDAMGAVTTIEGAAVYALVAGGPMVSAGAVAIGAGVGSAHAGLELLF